MIHLNIPYKRFQLNIAHPRCRKQREHLIWGYRTMRGDAHYKTTAVLGFVRKRVGGKSICLQPVLGAVKI